MLLPCIIGLAFYALASISLVLAYIGKRKAFFFSAKVCSLIAFIMLSIVLIVLTINLVNYGINSLGPEFYLVNLTWLLSIIALFTWHKFKKPHIFTLSSPLFFLLLHTAMLSAAKSTIGTYNSSLVSFLLLGHIASLSFALACLFIAGIAALLFIWQERALKKKKPTLQFKNFLSLESLDKLNVYATEIGFPFYTLGLLCGFLWASIAWESTFSGDIKEIISILVWLGYAGLFYMRLILKLTGKKPAYLLLILCALSLFSLLGVNFLFETHHRL